MKKSIKTAIQIQGSPKQVWDVLMDFAQYPSWNPFVLSIQGKPIQGETLNVQIDGFKLSPKVLECKANQSFKWLGHLWIKGLFDGEHQFMIDDNGDGTVTFRHEEYFDGILLPLFNKMLDTKTLQGFKAMNQRLKQRVEYINEQQTDY